MTKKSDVTRSLLNSLVRFLVRDLSTLKLRKSKFSDGTSVFLDGQMFIGGTKRLFTIPNDEVRL